MLDKNCVLYFLLVISFFSCNSNKEPANSKATTQNHNIELIGKSGFPKNWIGKWKGELKIDNTEKDTIMQIPMELNIAPTSKSGTWTWQLVYNGSPRDYELVAFKTEKGLFKMDEQNTIVLDQQLFDNTFISRYDVAGNLILVTNRLIEGKMLFEVIFSRSDSVNITGGEGDVPEVKSYPIAVYQRAVLEKE